MGFAFRSVEHALTIIVTHLESFSGLAAETERLDALSTGTCFCTCAWRYKSQRYSVSNYMCMGTATPLALHPIQQLACKSLTAIISACIDLIPTNLGQ